MLSILSGELVLGVEGTHKRHGSRAVLIRPTGQQIFHHDDFERLFPQQLSGLVMDIKGESTRAGASIIFWNAKVYLICAKLVLAFMIILNN